MANISIDQLAGEISRNLKDFSREVVDKVNLSAERVGKKAVSKLKKTSPKKTGKYSKGWKMVTEKATAQPDKRIIYNQNGQLTHLLEHGHAKVGGGRVEGIPHIRPAEQEVIAEYMAEVEEAIKGD